MADTSVIAVLQAPENATFSVAILLMLLIGALQVIGLGGDFAGVDADLDGDAGDLGNLLGWLGVGRLPLLMTLVVLLASFGLLGLIGQQVATDLTGGPLTPWIAVPGAALAALPLTAFAVRGLARVLPTDYSTAVTLETLAGRTATIVTGRAAEGSPARARVEDRHGQPHYVMVEPDNPGQTFVEGQPVLLVRREGDLFRAIARGDALLPSL